MVANHTAPNVLVTRALRMAAPSLVSDGD